MKKAVIFDMDGVIIDSQPKYFSADYQTLKQAGKDIEIKFTENYAGLANKERWLKYKNDLNLDQSVNELVEINKGIFNEILDNEGIQTVDGVVSLIKKLHENKIPLAVASSSPYSLIHRILGDHQIIDYFSVVISGEEFEKSKPEPEIFLKTAQKLGVLPEDCVVIEDSSYGVKAASRAKMKCVAYENPNSGKQDLSEATLIITDFHALIPDLDWL